MDVGIALLEPSADIRFSTPAEAENFLTYLTNIPGDLVDFYSDFGFHVRRGWKTLQRNIGAENFFSGIASYLPRNKNDDTVDSDDPTSPYSINYSGEYNNNQGYSYVIHNQDGNHTGYVSYPSQPSFKPNFTWSKETVHKQPGVKYDKNKDSWNYGNIVLYSAEQQKYDANINYQRMRERLKEKQEDNKKNMLLKLFQKHHGVRRNYDTKPEHYHGNVYSPTYDYIDYYY